MNRQHGHSVKDSPTYRSWKAMRGRVARHIRYTAIEQDVRWDSFLNFLEDMGERPEGTTLDRIDSKGHYTKSNCRWATWEEQGSNRSNTKLLSHLGETLPAAEWARRLGISDQLMHWRLKNGWSMEKMLEHK